MDLSEYVALCYHYLRPTRERDPFPRILGTPLEVFAAHLALLKQHYEIVSPRQAWELSCRDSSPARGRCGVLFTFDDGLADHYQVAQQLAESRVQALFFIPTCILKDREPANPTVIHYALAAYGIEGFLLRYRAAMEECRIPLNGHDVRFRKGQDDPWATIGAIKSVLAYTLPPHDGRRLLLELYRRFLLADYPEAMALMHLSSAQVRDLLDLGHVVGAHSHSHASPAAGTDETWWALELREPKGYLERTFDTTVNTLSYPFGEPRDCLAWREVLERTRNYDLAFTAQAWINTKQTSPWELGRYLPHSREDAERLVEAVGRLAGSHHVLG